MVSSVYDTGGYIGYSKNYPFVPIVTNGLVLYLDAGDKASYPGSGTTWTDLSEGGFNATLFNTPTYSNGYLTFNGTNQYASVLKPNPNIVGLISIEFWINFSATGNYVPVHKGNHYTLYFSSNTAWAWGDSSNYSYANFGTRTVSGGIYSTGQWYQFVVTKNSSFDVSLYRNGILLDTRTAFGGNLTAVTSTLWLGGYSDADTAPPQFASLMNANLSAVKIYNRALSAAEIAQNFNAFRKRFSI